MKTIQSLDKVELLKNILVSWAQGDKIDRDEYLTLRRELMEDPETLRLLPRFVRTCRNRVEFWSFIQPQFKSYRERRDFLQVQFEPLLSNLEECKALPPVISARTEPRVLECDNLNLETTVNERLSVFVSHSSQDSEIAEALADLLRAAFRISASKIRCTSTNGYRLKLGEETEEALRREVIESETCIGLITEASVESAYVLFEFGARWGAKRHLAPVLAAGANSSLLRGPISNLNALSCDDPAQVHQIIDDLSHVICTAPEKPASYQKLVLKLVTLSNEAKHRNKSANYSSAGDRSQFSSPEASEILEPVLEELEVLILKILAKHDGDRLPILQLVVMTNKSKTHVEYAVSELEQRKFLRRIGNLQGGTSATIDNLGRRYSIENRLV